jgi:hypothetical protein
LISIVIFSESFDRRRRKRGGNASSICLLRINFRILITTTVAFWGRTGSERGREGVRVATEEGEEIFLLSMRRRNFIFIFVVLLSVMVPRFFQLLLIIFFVFLLKKTMIWIWKETTRKKKDEIQRHILSFSKFSYF